MIRDEDKPGRVFKPNQSSAMIDLEESLTRPGIREPSPREQTKAQRAAEFAAFLQVKQYFPLGMESRLRLLVRKLPSCLLSRVSRLFEGDLGVGGQILVFECSSVPGLVPSALR